MSSFWTSFLDWFLPTIRLSDDIHDLEASYIDRIAHSHHRALGLAPSSGPDASAYHRGDNKSGRSTRRGSESEGNGHNSKADQDDYEVRKLQEENERLRKQVAQLQSQLEAQASERTHLTLSTKIASAPISSPPISPTSAVSPSTPSSSSEYYKSKYERLRKDHDFTRQTLNNYTAELSSLRSFLSKTDALDNASIRQSVQDLNGQVQQFAATVAETYHAELRAAPGYKRQVAVDPEHLDAVEQVVGVQMVELLMSRTHVSDPILLQYALQAWEVGCVRLILDAFCFGTPTELDHALSVVFKKMHLQGECSNFRIEPVATAARWRALTHSYLKDQLSHPSGVLPTPVTPTSDHPPTDPREHDIQRHLERNLVGVHTLLTIAGYPRSTHSLADRLRERHGPKLHLLCEESLKVTSSLREAFMSQFLEVVVIPPAGAQVESTSRRSDKHGLRIEVRNDAGRFDAATMENVLPLPSSKHADSYNYVLCTVELGLVTTSENEQSRHTAERHSSEHDSRIATSRSSLDTPQAISRTNSQGDSAHGQLRRQIMLKPKVLLESFVKYIDHEQ
ncbi:hypothetical protein BC835DRAFT_1411480 [Cytidiella melzeri]|nr:hypothetical protein BC835DRAFT_1411480 [Cytidiella melzeri]